MSGKSVSTLRARRWDLLVLGSAIPGLVAGIRVAMAGHRVLVAEEDATARRPDLLREPFSLAGVQGGGFLDHALRALGLPLIERRRLEPREIAYQVLLPEARLDVGSAELTAGELVAWGLAKPEDARTLVHDLAAAASASQAHLLEAPWLGRAARRGRGAEWPLPALPEAVGGASGELADFFGLQVEGLHELACSLPGSEACVRLLGAPLVGRSATAGPEGGLHALLKHRLEGLHAEFRTVGCPFEFVELSGHPGILRAGPGDVWLGRALIVNAPGPRLGTALAEWEKPVPGFLRGPPPPRRRVRLHLRALREVVPEALEPRALLAPRAGGVLRGPIRIALHPSPRGTRFAEIVASAAIDANADREEAAATLESEVRGLMPFSDKCLKAGPLLPEARWDDLDALSDPTPGSAWPEAAPLRTRSREPVFALDRSRVASLGVEGELLLGWRAGDAVREELG